MTCHDPHQDAEPAAGSYEAACLECHASPRRPANGPEAALGRSASGPECPVNPRADCVSCHMPKVKDAVPRTVFTDHWIRVRRPGESSSRPNPSAAKRDLLDPAEP